LLAWIKRRKRRGLLANPFPHDWELILDRNVLAILKLPPASRARLRDTLRILVAEKNWEGCGGLSMNDEIKVTVAAQASRLLLGFAENYFDEVQSVLVYPDLYVAPSRTWLSDGLVLEHESVRLGEAWHRGTVVLSWPEVLTNSRHGSGKNLVLHEFAHQLDMQNGRIADGIPPLATRVQWKRWEDVNSSEYLRLRDDCERGRPTLLDCYGASHRAEFFAVVTEAFFERPREMSQWHPELYAVFRDFYRQDPLPCQNNG
jgi:Mlc titration factor MtfA (ptsG expression regulator)